MTTTVTQEIGHRMIQPTIINGRESPEELQACLEDYYQAKCDGVRLSFFERVEDGMEHVAVAG